MGDGSKDWVVFSGSSHPELSKKVADFLGINLGKIDTTVFPDNEIAVQILESVRGRDAFVIQSLAGHPNRFLMELLITIDALKRASAKSIVAVIPYFGYCRQDRKDKARVPISAKLVANLLEKAGVDRVLTMDLHAGQVQGFFDVPVDNLIAMALMIDAVKDLELDKLVVVAPDAGSIKMARDYAAMLGVDFAVVDKVRTSSTDVAVTTVIGNVENKDVLLADDICSTGGTLVSAAKACREKGALRVVCAVTHGLFVGDCLKKVKDSPIEAFLVSNTIPVRDDVSSCDKIKIISVASLIGQGIHCINSAKSIHSLFESCETKSLPSLA